MKMWLKLCLGTFFTGYFSISTLVMVLLYGPNPGFRDWLVTTAMTTMTHQYFATWFYDQNTIKEVMSNNVVVEGEEATNPDLIQIGGNNSDNSSGTLYANEYEEQILKKDENNKLYKIIDIEGKNSQGKPMKGKMAVIYDPSKGRIAVSKGMGKNVKTAYGEMVKKMASDNGGIIGINASGFFDPGYNSMGGVPRGYVISSGKLVANNRWGRSYGGLIGFDNENRLILSKNMSAQEALDAGIRDGIQYGPFLIVNGEASFVKGNGGWGYAPRSVIAQRKDGIVLLLVIDGRQTASAGADMGDLVDILQKYGAYNAANLDGGTSSSMSYNGKIITNPRNGNFAAKTRVVPNAWIVVE
jgi:exopolysaccharide biosynthesis protein